jgi:hypothetical protein
LQIKLIFKPNRTIYSAQRGTFYHITAGFAHALRSILLTALTGCKDRTWTGNRKRKMNTATALSFFDSAVTNAGASADLTYRIAL